MIRIVSFIGMLTVSLHAKSISAYYTASYAKESTIKSKLEKVGFEVLSTYSPLKKEYLKVLVFTNKQLISTSSIKKCGFASIQRVLINNKTKKIRVTNPHYWLHAFMRKSYVPSDANAITTSLTSALGELEPTKDALEENEISKYHYAISMPYYKDMVELKNGKGLLQKIKKKKKLFEIKLSDKTTLVGVKLSKNSEKFIETIGERNALILPYTILIKDDKAYALAPKYYLAISYPLLSLGEFMKISSTPDAIIRKLKKVFN